MASKRRGLLGLVAAGLVAGCSVLGVRDGYEAPSYDVVDPIGSDLEVRRYGPRLAAETDNDNDQAFRRLFRYITGANEGEREIAMTVPVETAKPAEIAMTVPVEMADNRYMRFFLPAEFNTGNAPAPTDPAVRLVEVPEQVFAVLRYSGFGFESSVNDQKAELLERVRDTNWQPVGAPIAYFYDPPWTLPFFRRNEVLVEVTPLSG